MRAKKINEVQNFERGIGPKGSMKVGGVNLQEDFAFDLAELIGRYISKLRNLEGKTITCSVIIGFDSQIKTLKVERMFDIGIKLVPEDMIQLSQRFEDANGDTYQLDLREKIYIENES